MTEINEVRLPGTIGDEMRVTLWRAIDGEAIVVRFRTYDGDDADVEDFTGEIMLDVADLPPLLSVLETVVSRWSA